MQQARISRLPLRVSGNGKGLQNSHIKLVLLEIDNLELLEDWKFPPDGAEFTSTPVLA